MPSFHDQEFGEVTIRRSGKARSMKASVAPNGTLRISLPSYVPIIMAKRMVSSSRQEIRKLFSSRTHLKFEDGMQIGKSHSLHVRQGSSLSLKRNGQQIIATLGKEDLSSEQVQGAIRTEVLVALRKEAKHYLPKRLQHLASEHGYTYKSIRFSHASTRWGSCSSNLTISLNIGLMMLPFELIDYVLVHELAHTKEMNHSPSFWKLVEMADSNYMLHRKVMKSYNPGL